MKSSVFISIPSRGRPHLIKNWSGVFRYFDREERLNVFVREGEVDEYAKFSYVIGTQFYIVPDFVGIAQKRHEIVMSAMREGFEYCLMMDDHTTINRFYPSNSSRYKAAGPKHVADMIAQLKAICGVEFPMVGLPFSLGSQNVKHAFVGHKQIMDVYMLHLPTLIKEDIRFDGLGAPFMEDRYVQLSLLEKGYKVLTNYYYNEGGPGRTTGGCSSDVYKEQDWTRSAVALGKRFPEVVSLLDKPADGNWKFPRVDCKIDWLKWGESQYDPDAVKYKMEARGYDGPYKF